MQPVCPTGTSPAAARPPLRTLASGRPRCQARPRMGRAAGPASTALRAQCGGGPEPVEARNDGDVPSDGAQEDAGMAPEELELLEDEAMGGEDEGRRPTDYDRRAHIFEESSRVFRAIKQRRDGDGGGGGGGGVKVGAATAGHE